MVRSLLAAGAASIAIAVMVASTAPAVVSAQSGCHTWAYYMAFWTGSSAWERQASVLSDRPARGYYDTRDPGVAGAQIDEAKSAGIEAFIVDWWGPGDGATTAALANLMDRAAERGFQIAASVDSFDPRFNSGRSAMTDTLRDLVANRIHHPAYLRYQGKPVVFFAFQQNAGISPDEWQAIRSEIDPSRNTIWVAEGTKYCPLCGSAMDGMYAFNMAWSDGRAAFYTRDRDVVQQMGGWFHVPTVHPGWDEDLVAIRDGRANPTSRRDRADGQFLRSLWDGAAATGSDVRLIVSWNEFIENSHMEPSASYGDRYLGLVGDLAARGCGSVQPPPDPPSDWHWLVAEAEARQLIQFNPGAALQKRVFADGFVPNSGEYDVEAGGARWRGQRAEHLATGEVRSYFVSLGNWGNVYAATRGRTYGNEIDDALVAEADARQLIQFNPGASLQKRIFADGFVPNSPEFRATDAGVEYAAQRAEHLASGEVRVYYAPVGDYGAVAWTRR